jgi:hypothetical protein
MKTIRLFIWFTAHSWHFLKGKRVRFLIEFIVVWRIFYKLAKKEVL